LVAKATPANPAMKSRRLIFLDACRAVSRAYVPHSEARIIVACERIALRIVLSSECLSRWREGTAAAISDRHTHVLDFYTRHPIPAEQIVSKLHRQRSHLDDLTPEDLFVDDWDH
jgi:hypothetical protein